MTDPAGAGIYANMTGVYWWDPWSTTYSIHGSYGICSISQMRTMVLEYLPTFKCHFWGKCRCAYSSTMEHLGIWNIYKHCPKKSPSFVGTYTTTMQHMGDDTIHFSYFSWYIEGYEWTIMKYNKLYKRYHIFKIFAWDGNLTQHRNPRNPWPVHHRHDWALPSPTARTARQVGWLDVVGYSAPEKTYSHAEYISFVFPHLPGEGC